ncbi:probable protein S-acyltransferase 6 isoform X3 [Ricinus communis]|uniref:probable protein S-acyltransferase 6 isoform X3 n=1 Tax=Ricinus communis TaxID=3988 RepID=UPI000772AFC2|nr:probable protein S-acyltransferase 6 isoform X3 [Ricinus communis]|eukprot:XP_015583499.1 probable protein S-acyltransferase 6 isoform X2 [Ricinus communis]
MQQERRKEALLPKFGRCTVSSILVLLTQFSLSLIPRFFSASSFLLQLTLSGIVVLFVLGFGRWCRRLLGVHASAPAFVFLNLLFIWSVYFCVVRPAVPFFMDAIFSGEVVMLFIGDPLLLKRVRYCKSCKAYVKGFDHHCPAFGNCIGQSNHALFMVLLLGFLSTEASYIMCSLQFVRGSQIEPVTRFELGLRGTLVTGTMLFTLLQVLWQGIFMAWHIYCICFNIRTDEWINWKKYPEFQVIAQSQPGGSFSKMSFTNPYDKGILQNVKEFCAVRD